MMWVLVTGLWAAMLISPIVMIFLFLPAGRSCPRCNSETVPILSRLLRPFRRVVTRRWCMSCDWEGIARVTVLRRPLPRFEVVPDDGGDAEDEMPWERAS